MGSAPPLHLLQLTAPAPVGGLEAVVLALAEGLCGRGHRLTVVASTNRYRTHPFLGALRARGLEVITPPSGLRAESSYLRSFVSDHRIDIVHSHGYRPDVVSALACVRGRCATVSTVHGFTGGGVKNRFYEALQRAVLRSFDAVIVVSSPLEAQLRRSGIRLDRLHRIPNACRLTRRLASRAEARERLGLPPEGAVIGWVGRLSREKAPDLALRVLSLLPDRTWTAAFLGEGREGDRLRRLATDLGLASRIRWLGRVTDAARFFPAFDVLLNSSRNEGTPITLLEAMAAGVPIVATSVGGVPELLGQGAAGWLAPPEDPAALGRALEEALRERAAVARMTEAARSRLRNEYNPGIWLDRYEEVYRQILATR